MWTGYVAVMEEGRSAFKFYQAYPQERDLQEGLKFGWEKNIRMNLKIGVNIKNGWIQLQREIRESL